MAIDGIKEEKIRDGYKKTEIGEIPIDWEVNELSNICRVITGSTPKTSEKNNFGNEHPWVTPIDLGNKKYINKTNRMLSEIGFKKTRILPKGSILVTCIGSTIGKIGIANSKLSTNQQINSLIVKDKNILKEYIYYSLKYFFNKYKETYISHEAVPIINKGIFQKFKVAIPTYSEQQKIASILSTVDDLIENTDHLINSYTLLKKCLMQILLTKGIGHIRFKQTSIGEIPVEWEVKRLDDIFSITAGRDLVKEAFSPIKDNKHPFPIYSNSIENKGLYGYAQVARHKENSITITARGTIGRANTRTEKFDAIGRLLIMEPTEDLVCFFISEYVNHKVKFSIESTGVPQLTVPQASQYFVAFPPVKEQQKIASILSIIDNYLSIYVGKKENLNLLKKGLMQQLLTGKIRVKV